MNNWSPKKFGIFYIYFFLFVGHIAYSQTFFQINGQVVDKETQLPVPYTHIYMDSTSIGTVSNQDGYFLLKVDSLYTSNNLSISCIGYKNTNISLSNAINKTLRIVLEPGATVLDEVTVFSKSADEIIKEVIKRIPENYQTYPSYLTGFYRESKSSLNNGFLYVLEVLLKAYKKPYQYEIYKSKPKEHIKMIKARKKINQKIGAKFYGGIHLMFLYDPLSARANLLHDTTIANFKIETIIKYNGRSVYLIAYKPKTTVVNITAKGYLYVDTESYALVKEEVSVQNELHKNSNNSPRWYEYGGSINIHYKQFNNKWYLQSVVSAKRGYDKAISDTVLLTFEYITTKIDTTNVKPFPKKERLRYRNVLVNKIDNKDPNFWENYNILAETEELKRFFREESKR